MFGTNSIRKTEHDRNGTSLRVEGSPFLTIQGEGPFAGERAIFVRLAGCNLRCDFCDTAFESNEQLTPIQEIVERCDLLHNDADCERLVVLTGGEPMLQNIAPLITALTGDGNTKVQIETAGTVCAPGLRGFVEQGLAHIVCSPKTPKINAHIIDLCRNWKYIIRAGAVCPQDGLTTMNISEQRQLSTARVFRPPPKTGGHYQHRRPSGRVDVIWVQPCDDYTDEEKVELLRGGHRLDFKTHKPSQENMRACLESALKHGYRISLQLHKYLNVD